MKDLNRVAIYARLSREDEDKIDGNKESRSIENQIKVLSEYAVKNNFNIVKIYYDDGVSGGTLNRPGLESLMHDCENDKFDILIIKDLSRLGRVLHQVANLIDNYFPNHRIRVISLSDHYDSSTYLEDGSIVIRNFINSYYLKDFKKKINKSFDYRGKIKKLTMNDKYGFILDSEKNRIIDPYAASIIKRIFKEYNEGKSPMLIADDLNRDGVLSPAIYLKKVLKTKKKYNTKNEFWNYGKIKKIIIDYEYCGHAVNFVASSSRENVIIRDVFPKIITEDTYTKAQNIRGERSHFHKNINHLASILYDKNGFHPYYNMAEKIICYYFKKAGFSVHAEMINKLIYEDVLVTIENCIQDPAKFKEVYKRKILGKNIDLNNIQSLLKKANKEYALLFESYISGTVDDIKYKCESEALKNRINEYENSITNLQTLDYKINTYERQFKEFLEKCKTNFEGDKIDFVKSLVSKVTIERIGGTRKNKKIKLTITYKFEEV